MGICGQAIKEDTQEKKDLTKRKNRLTSYILINL